MVEGEFGGHGSGIYCFEFNPDNGELKLLHTTPSINPSYLCISSSKYLYTHTEILKSRHPLIRAFEIRDDYSLRFINDQYIEGGCPCYINYSKTYNILFVACYETGDTFIYPVRKDGRIAPVREIIKNEGSSVNKQRQESAHAHAVLIDEGLGNILIADLGIDKIVSYKIKKDNKSLSGPIQEILMSPGSGPRHLIFHPQKDYLYVVNELTGTIMVMRYEIGHLCILDTYSILPSKTEFTPSAAAIRISDDGRFIYVSERRDSCISILKFDRKDARLSLIGREKTLGKTPRDFILDPSGNWLLAANQDSDSIAIFKVNKKTGMIKPIRLMNNIKSPVCFEWLPEK